MFRELGQALGSLWWEGRVSCLPSESFQARGDAHCPMAPWPDPSWLVWGIKGGFPGAVKGLGIKG